MTAHPLTFVEFGNSTERSEELFQADRVEVFKRTDRLFASLMTLEWLAGIATALWITPRTWIGQVSELHIYLWAAIFLGGAICALPVALAILRPGETVTRHVIGVGQMLFAALAIHLTGGRIETHFLVFGSLAFLAFYRDWRVLISASFIVAVDHFLRGFYMPQSVYGVLTPGSWRWLEHSGWVVFEDVFLTIACLQGVREMRDSATKRAQLELTNLAVEAAVVERTRELKASEERFRTLSASSPTGIIETDTAGRCLYANGRWQEISGLTMEESLGDGWTRAVHPEDAQIVATQFAVDRSGEPYRSAVSRVIASDHQVRWVAIRVAPIRGEQGTLTGYAGTVEDITERIHSERDRATLLEELKRQRLRLQNIMENLPGIVWESWSEPDEAEQRINFVSAHVEKMLGYTVDEWLATPEFWLTIVHPADRDLAAAQATAIFRSLKSGTLSFRWVAKDQSIVWVDTQCLVVSDSEGTPIGMRGVTIDVTQHRMLEMQLERVNRVTSLGRLAATIAHETNNVLMGIQAFTEILKRRVPDDPTLQGATSQIIKSVDRGRRITQEILRFTHPADPVLKPIWIANWIDDFGTELTSLLGAKVKLELDIVDRDLAVLGDGAQLQQLMSNLFVNARDAMKGEGTLRLTVERCSEDSCYEFGMLDHPERYIHFAISDTGSGMSPETLSHVFEPLFTTKKSGGTGLGLSIAHQLVQGQGGLIFVESVEGVGTTFHIFLPVSTSDQVADVEGISDFRTGVRRLLLVEDEEAVADGLQALLGLEGIEVEVVGEGKQVPEAIARFQPDVVVLDVGLPDMDGTEVYEELAKRWPQLPVIFSTGHATLETLPAVPHVGHLLKPYDYATLLAAIETVTTGAVPPARVAV